MAVMQDSISKLNMSHRSSFEECGLNNVSAEICAIGVKNARPLLVGFSISYTCAGDTRRQSVCIICSCSESRDDYARITFQNDAVQRRAAVIHCGLTVRRGVARGLARARSSPFILFSHPLVGRQKRRIGRAAGVEARNSRNPTIARERGQWSKIKTGKTRAFQLLADEST